MYLVCDEEDPHEVWDPKRLARRNGIRLLAIEPSDQPVFPQGSPSY